MNKVYSVETYQEMVKDWKSQLDLALSRLNLAKQIADYQPELDLAEAHLINLRQRMINFIKKIVTDAVVLALTQCPDCGSKNVNHNPLDDSKYICKDCGKWFD